MKRQKPLMLQLDHLSPHHRLPLFFCFLSCLNGIHIQFCTCAVIYAFQFCSCHIRSVFSLNISLSSYFFFRAFVCSNPLPTTLATFTFLSHLAPNVWKSTFGTLKYLLGLWFSLVFHIISIFSLRRVCSFEYCIAKSQKCPFDISAVVLNCQIRRIKKN